MQITTPMFYFSYIENEREGENTFVISLHPYKVEVVSDCLEDDFHFNGMPNMDFELYKLIMSN